MKKIILGILLWIPGFLFANLDLDMGLTPTFDSKTVWISSNPSFAEVYLEINGKWELLGKTPVQTKIKVGEKKIKLVKTGYQETILKINSKNKQKYSIDLEIEKKTVDIQSNPSGAVVYIEIDNQFQKLGETPLSQSVQIGERTIKLSKEGYLDYIGKMDSEKISAPLKIELKKIVKNKTITIDSKPDKVKVYVSNLYLGETPYLYTIPAEQQSIALKLSKEGYEDFEKTVNITNQEKQNFSFPLNKLPYGYIAVTSSEENTDIYVNGEYYFTAPQTIKIKAGIEVTVKVIAGNFGEQTQNVTVAKNETKNIHFTMMAEIEQAEKRIRIAGKTYYKSYNNILPYTFNYGGKDNNLIGRAFGSNFNFQESSYGLMGTITMDAMENLPVYARVFTGGANDNDTNSILSYGVSLSFGYNLMKSSHLSGNFSFEKEDNRIGNVFSASLAYFTYFDFFSLDAIWSYRSFKSLDLAETTGSYWQGNIELLYRFPNLSDLSYTFDHVNIEIGTQIDIQSIQAQGKLDSLTVDSSREASYSRFEPFFSLGSNYTFSLFDYQFKLGKIIYLSEPDAPNNLLGDGWFMSFQIDKNFWLFDFPFRIGFKYYYEKLDSNGVEVSAKILELYLSASF
ncbi:MAG TPA: hypothetical protein DHW82_05770 [Spirochaetia bacterium]|nr:MAG: hypothetical protein A2Y41_12800 [Spirochaetes bacterium GWB1_36_13]HCL56501.1 hypothetical protein [Spirochaetia bacterium]